MKPLRNKPKTLAQQVEEKIAALAAIDCELPSVVIIHRLSDSGVEYMSANGRDILGVDLKELQNMGKEYYGRFFNPEDAKDYVPKIIGMLERNNNDEIISYFQQVRRSEEHEYQWYLSATRIFMRDEDGKPVLIITIACPMNPKSHNTAKIERVLEENTFLRTNYANFAKLGKREKEVLRLTALGRNSAEIAKEMYISVATVETHRRNLKKKLQANTAYELSQYARAFDLI